MPSELIKKPDGSFYTPGCSGVIEIVKDVQENVAKNGLCKKYFLGIIDGDHRKYTGEQMGELQCLFTLKYYSYESHFTTDDSAKQLIEYITRVAKRDITKEIMDEIMEEAAKTEDELYFVGLEILNEKMNPCREKLFAEDTKPETLYQEKEGISLMSKVLEMEEELKKFANNMGICQKDIRSIVKGKYLLYAFVKVIYEQVGKLSSKCRDGHIEQCDYCKCGKFNQCIWKVKNQLNRSEYNNIIIDVSWKTEPEIQYIKDRLSMLG